RINLAWAESPLRIPGHGAVDEVPNRLGIRQIAPGASYRVRSVECANASRQTRPGKYALCVLSMAEGAPGGEELRAFHSAAASGRELLSFGTYSMIPGLHFGLRGRPTQLVGRALRPRDAARQQKHCRQ